MTEDVFNLDNTVDVVVDCYLKMQKNDYYIMSALGKMTDEEKHRLLYRSIPQITARRVLPPQPTEKKKHRLTAIKVYKKSDG